ncbi:MAG: stage II sporulation protein R [Firmicutes bacterium HGW-Firmicutes-1]|nr:MAG: stage II sporulation protein R [Firmicutes bacterium HGW-Firmicutes-1]
MKNNNSFIIKKTNKRRTAIGAGIVILALLAIIYDMTIGFTKEKDVVVEGLSNSLIRFHVIANSDSEEDQSLKVKVKDEVIEMMQVLLQESTSVDASREIILKNMSNIKQTAENVINENNFSDEVTIALQKQEFPLKQYGDIVLPPGEYEALVIRIGAAEGKNWWCVLFPPLCFVDATHGVVDNQSKQALKDVLSDDEYAAIVMSKDKDVNIKVKSRLFKWFSEKDRDDIDETVFADKR